MRLMAAIALSAMLAACSTMHEAMRGPPALTPAAGSVAPPQAQLYADCLAQATSARAYDREQNWIRFHCGGAPAQAFYDGLGAFSANIHSEMRGDGRIYRFTQRPQHDTAGLDACWRDDAGGYGCTVVLNVGEFLGPATTAHSRP